MNLKPYQLKQKLDVWCVKYKTWTRIDQQAYDQIVSLIEKQETIDPTEVNHPANWKP